MTKHKELTNEQFYEEIIASTFINSKTVPFSLEVKEIPSFLKKLELQDTKLWGIHIEIIRRKEDQLNGSLISLLYQRGIEKITTTLFFDESNALISLNEIHFLRECASHYISVEWRLESQNPIDCLGLVHLPPPTHYSSQFSDWAQIWRDNYLIESLIYRKGPKYIKVKDTRQTLEAQIFELTNENETELFNIAKDPVRLSELSKYYPLEIISLYLENYLFLQVEEWVINLSIPVNSKCIPYV